jgi:hypothetical protein
MTIGGSLILSANNLAGTTTFTLNGSGAVSCANPGALGNRYLAGTLTINTAGTVTFGQYWNFQGNFTVTAGTVDMTTNSCQFTTFNSTTFGGSLGVTFSTLEICFPGAGAAQNITFLATKAYPITNKFLVSASPDGSATTTIKSNTGSSSALLNYTGSLSNLQVFGALFTDIDASGSTTPILNYFGSTLTRTTNIQNVTLPTTMGYVWQ